MDFDDFIWGFMIFGIVVLVISGTSFAVCFSFGLDSGSGKHIGFISEVEKTGFLWQKPIVKIVSANPTYSEADTAWWYGCSEELALKAEELMNNNTKVIVYYKMMNIAPYWEYSSRVIITGIEPAG